MLLYTFHLQRPTGIHQAVYGNFSGPNAQEIIISRGNSLEVWSPEEDQVQKIQLCMQFSFEVFGQIRSIQPFRLIGRDTDMLLVGSDSGKIALVSYYNQSFTKIHLETFGRSGCRRIVPGQYLASDPKGRAIMIGAIEKFKYVYVLNNDSNNQITISSPLSANKGKHITFDMCGIDVGFENPCFASIEAHCDESQQIQKKLVFYEMDLGLNNVVRKEFADIPESAHKLIATPNQSGVIICCDSFLVYLDKVQEKRVMIPRREGINSTLITSCSVHQQKNMSFLLLCSEQGDLYKLTFNKDMVFNIQYFDSIQNTISLCILKTGYLFAASDIAPHAFYQFVGVGEDEPIISSSEMEVEVKLQVRNELRNLLKLEELNNFSSINDMQIADLTQEGQNQFYLACGREQFSSLKILRNGLSVSQLADSKFQNKPGGVFTLKNLHSPEFEKFILVSFANATIVLEVTDKINEKKDSRFDTTVPTILAGTMKNCYIQVCVHQILKLDINNQVEVVQTSGKVTNATCNQKQLAISLQGGIVIYYELDKSGKLLEIEKKEMEQEVICIEVGPIPQNRIKCRFLAVGCYDNTVRLLSLDPENCLSRLAYQSLPGSQPESAAIIESQIDQQLYLHVGLTNGALLRTLVDPITGQLSDRRIRYVGKEAVRLVKLSIQSQPAVLALGSRPWLSYIYQKKFTTHPLIYDTLDYAAQLQTQSLKEGIVAISQDSLKIFTINKLGEAFSVSNKKLKYTPRKILTDQVTNSIFTFESEIISENPHPQWGSGFREINALTLQDRNFIPFHNECITSCFIGEIRSPFNFTHFLIVGTAVNFRPLERKCDGGKLYLYSLQVQEGLKLIYVTDLEDMPLGISNYQQYLLVGVNNVLRLYECGKQKLLKKCENKHFKTGINKIIVINDRIFVSDMSDSFIVVKWMKEDNQLVCICDDTIPRWPINAVALDKDTLFLIDKFQNFAVIRVPPGIDDPGQETKYSAGFLNAAAFKFLTVCHYHLGDMITCVQKIVLQQQECLVIGTAQGALYAVVPLANQEERKFFQHLELQLRAENLSILGRDHLVYRSTINPVKGVIDGSLCEMFYQLDLQKQKDICAELEKTQGEIFKRLEDIKNNII